MRKGQIDERLSPCTLVKPGNVNSVENKDGWMKIKFMVDSGANDTVIPLEELPDVPHTGVKGIKVGMELQICYLSRSAK